MKKFILWTLLIFISLIGLALLSLNLVSGTGDSQRRGLEQVFSDAFKGTASIEKLTHFNIAPQFLIGLENLNVINMEGGGSLSVARAQIGFGFLDLILKSRRIESFAVENVKLTGTALDGQEIIIDKAMIEPATDGTSGMLTVTGKIGRQNLAADMAFDYDAAVRGSYSLPAESPFHLTLGKIVVSGVFAPMPNDQRGFTKLHLEAGRESCNQPAGQQLSAQVFFTGLLPRLSQVKASDNLQSLCALIAGPDSQSQ